MAVQDFTFSNLTTAESGFTSTTAFLVQSLDEYTISVSNGTISLENVDFSFYNETRPGFLIGRRPSLGQIFPRGVYNK